MDARRLERSESVRSSVPYRLYEATGTDTTQNSRPIGQMFKVNPRQTYRTHY